MFSRVGEISEMQCFRLLKVDTLYNDPEFVKKKNTEEVILIEELSKPAEDSTSQPVRIAYRYEYDKGIRGPEPVVWTTLLRTDALSGNRFLHKEWVADLYKDWKNREILTYVQEILERVTPGFRKKPATG